jgi:hypothetical protein
MKRALILALAGTTAVVVAAAKINLAEDDASQGGYNEGWSDGKGGGNGFRPWIVRMKSDGEPSHSGVFIANAQGDNPGAEPVAVNGKAFGLYANGVGFEETVVYREFLLPLQTNDVFSINIKHGTFERKFENDSPEKGELGVALRSGPAGPSTAEWRSDARMILLVREGENQYRIIDGAGDTESGVDVSDAPLGVSVTVTGDDTYDLELVNLRTQAVKKLPGRKLMGSSGAAISSVAVFNRDGEREDFFFNSLQIARPAGK